MLFIVLQTTAGLSYRDQAPPDQPQTPDLVRLQPAPGEAGQPIHWSVAASRSVGNTNHRL